MPLILEHGRKMDLNYRPASATVFQSSEGYMVGSCLNKNSTTAHSEHNSVFTQPRLLPLFEFPLQSRNLKAPRTTGRLCRR